VCISHEPRILIPACFRPEFKAFMNTRIKCPLPPDIISAKELDFIQEQTTMFHRPAHEEQEVISSCVFAVLRTPSCDFVDQKPDRIATACFQTAPQGARLLLDQGPISFLLRLLYAHFVLENAHPICRLLGAPCSKRKGTAAPCRNPLRVRRECVIRRMLSGLYCGR